MKKELTPSALYTEVSAFREKEQAKLNPNAIIKISRIIKGFFETLTSPLDTWRPSPPKN